MRPRQDPSVEASERAAGWWSWSVDGGGRLCVRWRWHGVSEYQMWRKKVTLDATHP